MTLINIAKDDVKPFFIDASDLTALGAGQEPDTVIFYGRKEPTPPFELQKSNLDWDDMVQKIANAGVELVRFTMHRNGKVYPHFIAPSAVTFAAISEMNKTTGMAAACIGVKGASGFEGVTTPQEIQTLIDAVRKTKLLLEYKPEEASWRRSAMLYIDPASVIGIEGSYAHGWITVSFGKSGTLNVEVAYANELDPETSLAQKALKIYGEGKYTGAIKGIRGAVTEIHEQLEREAYQKRIDFTHEIASNSNLIDISSGTHAAFVRKEDISTISFMENDIKQPGLNIRAAGSIYIWFNTAAERKGVLAALTSKKPHLKP